MGDHLNEHAPKRPQRSDTPPPQELTCLRHIYLHNMRLPALRPAARTRAAALQQAPGTKRQGQPHATRCRACLHRCPARWERHGQASRLCTTVAYAVQGFRPDVPFRGTSNCGDRPAQLLCRTNVNPAASVRVPSDVRAGGGRDQGRAFERYIHCLGDWFAGVCVTRPGILCVPVGAGPGVGTTARCTAAVNLARRSLRRDTVARGSQPGDLSPRRHGQICGALVFH